MTGTFVATRAPHEEHSDVSAGKGSDDLQRADRPAEALQECADGVLFIDGCCGDEDECDCQEWSAKAARCGPAPSRCETDRQRDQCQGAADCNSPQTKWRPHLPGPYSRRDNRQRDGNPTPGATRPHSPALGFPGSTTCHSDTSGGILKVLSERNFR
ncbi:hypothetical protein GCM10017714_19480 [Curtobacterium pusillum]|nr:hypothetical protein GCM10017610_26000 [Curtobacterium pusillum]